MPRSFFTEFTFFKGVLYSVCVLYVLCSIAAVMFEPFADLPCSHEADTVKYPNVLYVNNLCRKSTRYRVLLGLTPQECVFGRHLVVATVLGGIVGYERKTADRPAGIRTMSLVSLAAALLTLNSTFAFRNGPMEWDAARVSAAIPSGVGFLGAGLIVKNINKDAGEMTYTVNGLNTASSVWLSAAIGIACGGGLYVVATYTAGLVLVLMRFGPRFEPREDGAMVLPDRHRPSVNMALLGDAMTAEMPKRKKPSINF